MKKLLTILFCLIGSALYGQTPITTNTLNLPKQTARPAAPTTGAKMYDFYHAVEIRDSVGYTRIMTARDTLYFIHTSDLAGLRDTTSYIYDSLAIHKDTLLSQNLRLIALKDSIAAHRTLLDNHADSIASLRDTLNNHWPRIVALGKDTSHYLLANGTRPLTADWNAGNFKITTGKNVTDSTITNHFKMAGAGSAGYVLKRDADGNGSWEELQSSYLGTWNANTNTPTISDATGNIGEYYIVSVGDTIDLGSGNVIFVTGGSAIHNGTVWQSIIPFNSVVTVNSLNGTVQLNLTIAGDTLYLTGSPDIDLSTATSIVAVKDSITNHRTALHNAQDSIAQHRTDINLKVPKTTTISTTLPLTGGGDLSANRTLAINPATTTLAGSQSAEDKVKMNVVEDYTRNLGSAAMADVSQFVQVKDPIKVVIATNGENGIVIPKYLDSSTKIFYNGSYVDSSFWTGIGTNILTVALDTRIYDTILITN